MFLSVMASLQNTQSVSRSFTQNNNYITRFYGTASWLGIAIAMGILIAPFYDSAFLEVRSAN